MASNKRVMCVCVYVCMGERERERKSARASLWTNERVYANFLMGPRDGLRRGSLAGDIVSENERGGYVPKNRTLEMPSVTIWTETVVKFNGGRFRVYKYIFFRFRYIALSTF